MQVEIREGGDGVACWNADAIAAYATSVDAREAELTATNPDLTVTPGRIKCWGCEVLEYDMGTRCTAELVRSLFSVSDEIAPRDEDAKRPINEIPDLVSRLDADPEAGLNPEYHPAAPVAPPSERPRGLRGLLGRRG